MSEEKGVVYPKTRAEELIEVIGGVMFHDPYRWLEGESEAAIAWQKQQNDLSDRILREWDGFDQLKQQIAKLIAPLGVIAPLQHARKWYSLHNSSIASCLRISDTAGGIFSEIVLSERKTNDPNKVEWFIPSPDGRYIAYGIPEGGGAQGGIQLTRVQIWDLEEKLRIPWEVHHVAYRAVAWLPDSTGFYYVAGLDHASRNAERRVYLHQIGANREDYCEPLRGLSYCAPQLSPDGRYLALIRGFREPRADLILNRAADSWRLFLNDVPAACFGFFDGDRYIALTTLNAERGRIVSIPIKSANDFETWKEIVPQSDGVIRNVVTVHDKYIVTDLCDANSRIRIFSKNGKLEETLPIPNEGSVSPAASWTWWHYTGMPTINAGERAISFVHSSFTSSPATYTYEVEAKVLQRLNDPEIVLNDILIKSEVVTADDGARIPLKLLYLNDVQLEHTHPTVIFAYGGYNHAFVPAFLAMFAPLIEAHGVLAFAHIRGGGEFGADWWRAGHHENKQRSFDDIYSVAEWLITEGWSDSSTLGIVGASNGGMNVAVAATQRPELFRAAVALVPQCDLLRYSRDPFYGGKPIEGHHNGVHIHGGTWRSPPQTTVKHKTPYFADSVYPEPFAYSPYHAVKPGTAYPAILVVSASEDLWCPPWHGRKFVARLQNGNLNGRPSLLRVWTNEGHDVPILGNSVQVAEWIGFLMRNIA
jgi:prolyl oligopeptidase